MGLILQKNEISKLIPIEREPIDITNWKMISHKKPGPIKFPTGITIYVDERVFFIYEITLKEFIKIIRAKSKASYQFSYVMSSLRCCRCGGTGIIDWVEKITRSNQNQQLNLQPLNVDFKRDDDSSKLHILDYYGNVALTSSPKLKLGDEICYECYGCGIRLNNFNYRGITTFDDLLYN